MKMFVCTTCLNFEPAFLVAVKDALRSVEVSEIDCMSGCTRDQCVAFRAPGKVAYLFGDLSEADLPELQNFADLYVKSPDGTFEDARVLGNLRTKAIARIPA